MGAPIGNKNAKGNPGGKKGRSGRKSYVQEKANYDALYDMWFKKHSMAELKNNIRNNKITMADVMLYKALQGDQNLLIHLFNKVYPASAMKHKAKLEVIALEAEKRYDVEVP